MVDTPTGETPQEPLTPASSASDPTVNATPAVDVEAQKQADKLQMEINMLRKQKDTLEKEKAEREKKELEEKEDYRSLATRAQAEAEALRKEKEDAEAKTTAEAATADVYKDFPANVIEIAKTAGLTAQDSEESRAELKAKLEAIQKNVGTTPTIQGNNPAPAPSEQPFDPVKVGKLMRVDDRNLREPAIKEAIGNHPQVKAFAEYAKKANNLEPQSF